MLKQGLGSPNIIAGLHDLGSVFRADKSTEPAAQDVNDCGVFDFRELARVGEVIACVLFIAGARVGLIAVCCWGSVH